MGNPMDVSKQVVSDDLVKEIKVDGKPLPGFTSEVTDYSYSVLKGSTASVPQVDAAAANSNVNIKVTQANDFDGTAVVKAQSKDGLLSKEYQIHFSVNGQISLSDIDWKSGTTGWASIQKDKSVDGNALSLATDSGVRTFDKGIGTHANSEIVYDLSGKGFTSFQSYVGVDHEVGGNGTISFQVLLDGQKIFDSGRMTGSTPAKLVDVDVTGKQELKLIVTDVGDGNSMDHADWADAKLTIK
jgi:beta-galactosidase